jgi:Predicted membrane protein (DUF2207)
MTTRAILFTTACFLPAVVVMTVIWARYGREPLPTSRLPYLHEPPDDLVPALAATMLEPGTNRVPRGAFPSTILDLIRRKYFTGESVFALDRSHVRERETVDLVLARGPRDPDDLLPFERVVFDSLRSALSGKLQIQITELPAHIRNHEREFRQRFRSFAEALIQEAAKMGWWRGGWQAATRAGSIAWATAIVGVALVWLAANVWGPDAAIDLIPIPVAAASNGLLLLLFLVFRRGWESRSPETADEVERWRAFKKFLTDFRGIEDAPPASIDLWERYLCYGTAFGVADRVLKAAGANAPDGLVDTSRVYQVGPDMGDGGSGDFSDSWDFGDIFGGDGGGDGGGGDGGGGGD